MTGQANRSASGSARDWDPTCSSSGPSSRRATAASTFGAGEAVRADRVCGRGHSGVPIRRSSSGARSRSCRPQGQLQRRREHPRAPGCGLDLLALDPGCLRSGVEVRCDEADQVDRTPAMALRQNLLDVKSVSRGKAPPRSLDRRARVDEDAVQVGEHGVRLEQEPAKVLLAARGRTPTQPIVEAAAMPPPAATPGVEPAARNSNGTTTPRPAPIATKPTSPAAVEPMISAKARPVAASNPPPRASATGPSRALRRSPTVRLVAMASEKPV